MRKRTIVLATAIALTGAPAAHAATTAPGAPGDKATWTPADKDGYGTSTTTQSKVWHTLSGGQLTEVYFPDLGTPSVRTLDLVITDGRTWSQRDETASRTHLRLLDRRSLTYRQVDVQPGRFRVTKTYVEDPARNTLLIRVHLESLTGKKLAAYAVYDPSLGNDGDDDSGTRAGRTLLASDSGSPVASALAASPGFTRTSSGYQGTSDGWTDLRDDHRMDWTYRAAPNGNVVQTGRTSLTGLRGRRDLTLGLGFGRATQGAAQAAHRSLAAGFGSVATAYATGWHRYLRTLKPAPASADPTTYDVSAMVLAAHEDKTYRGAYIASPTMPWAWGTGLSNPSDAYHLVWARDLYQIATALAADGDTAGANRAVTYLFDRQQKPDGSFPQNSRVDGTPQWTNLQLDEVALPIVLAWQLHRTGAGLYRDHIKKAADFLVNFPGAPFTPQERWENQSGYSPATTAAEIAGLICAADIAHRNGDDASARTYRETADRWQQQVQGQTATSNGPYSPRPYYLRLTKDGNPNAGTTYSIGDSGPTAVDQRKVVDPSFLELVRLGVKPASDPVIRNTLSVVDQVLGAGNAGGRYFWHRFTFDGYGETKTGAQWDINQPVNPTEDWINNTTIGRNWPIFGGERGEYDLLAGERGAARASLAHMASAANDGYLIPEQVWAPDFPPAGQPGFTPGEGTFSATPLAWSHAQYIRLAWSIQAGHPVEQPSIVAARYAAR